MSTPNPFDELFYGSAESEQDELLAPETTAPQPPASLPEQSDRNPFDDLFYGAPEPGPEPEPVPEEMGTFENLWAGLRERGASLIGDLAGGIQTIGNRAELEMGLGGFVHHGGLDFDYLSPEEWRKYSENGGRMGLLELQDEWKSASYGFTSNSAENWEKLKSDAGLWDKTQAAAAFALETGVISLADMAGAVVAPPAYIVARTEEIAQERAVNAGRAGNPTNDDLKIAFGTAVIIQAMERFGFDKIAEAFTAGGSALQRILTAGLAEGATEGVQEPLEYVASTYGTPVEEAQTPKEYALSTGETSLQGMLGGGPTGAVLATPSILLGTQEGPISDEVKDLDENRHAVTRALNEQAMRMEQEGVIQDQREMLESEQQQAELEIQRAADEIDAQEKTYKSAAHAELALQKLEQKYGVTSLFPSQMEDGSYILEPYGKASARRTLAERQERLGGLGQRPAETGQIEVTEGEEIVGTEPAPTTEGIEVGEEITIEEPAPTTEGIEVTEQPLDLIPDPTARRIAVTELEPEQVVGTEPAPTTEGIEVEEIQTQELDEGLPQIGVQEITEGEEVIEAPRKIYTRKKKKPAAPEPEPTEAEAETTPIMPQISSGAIAKGRKERKGIDAEIAEVEAELAKIPSDINIDQPGADVLMDQAHKLRIQRRDLLDEKRYRITPEEAKQARKEMWEKLREAGESVKRYETIEEMRARLGDRAVDTVREGIYKRVVDKIVEAEEAGIAPTVQYLQQELGINPLAAKKNLDRYKKEVSERAEPQALEAPTEPGGRQAKVHTVKTEDRGDFEVTVTRLEDGSAAILDQSGDGQVIEYNAAFVEGKTDQELLEYTYEIQGYQGSTEAAVPGGPEDADFAVENFLGDVASVAEEVDGQYRFYNSNNNAEDYATVDLTEYMGMPNVKIEMIEASRPGNGSGTQAMQQLIEIADEHGVVLELEPVISSTDPETLGQEELENWYRGFGFEFDPDFENLMRRQPGTPPAAPAAEVDEDMRVPGRLDTDVLPDGTEYDLSKSAETQIATTVGTYDKVKERYFAEVDNGEILDYGAGKGLASQKYGFESLEPYPRGWTPDYQNTYKIKRQYDGVILNNILNVLPKHTRRAVLFDAAEKMRDGARMYINVRSRGDVMKTAVIQKKFNDSEILTGRGTYQKGFQQAELIKFVQDELGPDYAVEKGEFGSVSIIVTKRTEADKELERTKGIEVGDRVRRHLGRDPGVAGPLEGLVTKIDGPFAYVDFGQPYDPSPIPFVGLTKDETLMAAARAAEREEAGREPTDNEAQAAAFDFIDENLGFMGLKLSHKPGDDRYGKKLTHYYGDIDGTSGADGDPVDVILNKDFVVGDEYPIYIANLTPPKEGDFEQHKVLAGFLNREQALEGLETMYPNQVDSIEYIDVLDFRAWLNSERTKVPFEPEQFSEAMEKGEDLGKPAADDTVMDPVELAASEAGPIDYSPWLLADGSIVDGGADHMDYITKRGVYAEDSHDLRAVSTMQLEAGGVRSAFYYDGYIDTAVAWMHVHEDQALTEAQIDTVEKFAQSARKEGRKVKILIGSTPTYDPETAPKDFNPVAHKTSIAALRRDYGERKRKYRAQMEKFFAGLAEKSAKYAKAAGLALRAQLRPDPTKDDIITFLRKHGGLNVNLGGDWRGRLSHLNKEYRLPGLPGIEQTDGSGLSMDQAAEIAWESNYIREYDADLLADLLDRAEDGTQLYSDQNQEWMRKQWQEQQDEYIAQMADETAAEMKEWAKNLDDYDAVDNTMSDLMAEASLIDEGEVERIVSDPDLSDEAVKEQLRNLIDERKQATEPEGVEAAEEAVEADAGVEAEAPAPAPAEPVQQRVEKPDKEPAAGDYDSISEYPWQELAAFHDVEILEPPSPDYEGPRTFVIDVYSDLKRTKFKRRIYAANFFRLRDVESAVLGRMGPYRGRLQERDEFIEINKISYEDQDGHYSLIEEVKGDQSKPYHKIKPIERIEDERAADRKQERQRRESGWLTPEQWGSTVERYNDELLAEPDPRDVVKHWGEEFKKKGTPRNYISHEEGRKKIAEWEAHAKAIGNTPDTGNSQRVILSLFDRTGEWAQPWIDAGYDVRAIDLARDDVDIMDIDYGWLLDMGFLEGPGVWGILAACPCQKFTNTNRQDFKTPGPTRKLNEGGADFIGATHKSVDLVNQTLQIIEFLKPRFWALENPLGRIQDITGAPTGRLSFNPNNYGDPYTKKTVLHGNFNADLPLANVDPREEFGGQGTKMHKLGSRDELDGGLRSVTPKGFAYAFFMANNDIDNPVADEIVQKEFVRTIPDDVKEADPNIERKVELVAKLALLDGTYPNQSDLDDGTVKDYSSGNYRLTETDNWPKWAKILIDDVQRARRDDWRIDDGNVATVRELNHLDEELRTLLNVGQKKEVQFPKKEYTADEPRIQTLNELGDPYTDEDFSIIDPYMTEAAVEAVSTALDDLAAAGYSYAELRGKPRASMPAYLADPLGVIIEVASGAIPVAKALRAVQKGDKRTKPETAYNRIANWNEKLEEAVGQQALSHEEFKQHIREEYPFLAKALDEVDGDDDGMAMRRQRPDPVTAKAEMYESLGRDDLAWAPAPEPMMPAEVGPPPPIPPRPEAETAQSWEPVPEIERPPEVDINRVLEASTQGEGTALSNIALSTQVGERTITHNAKWFKDAIDSRLERLNKLRGCA